MQSQDRVLARRYAQALFEIAAAAKEADRVGQELAAAFKALAPQMQFFKHPLTGAARQKALLQREVASIVSSKTLRLLELLVDKKRFYLLPFVLTEFGRLVDERQGVVRAQVRSAAELSAAQAENLREKLETFTGKRVVLETKTASELLGGVSVRLGDWVLDGSLQGRLKQLAVLLAGV